MWVSARGDVLPLPLPPRRWASVVVAEVAPMTELVTQDTLLTALQAERLTGMPGPPPQRRESPRLKQARLLALARELSPRRPRTGVAA